jgi:hypothetical protein
MRVLVTPRFPLSTQNTRTFSRWAPYAVPSVSIQAPPSQQFDKWERISLRLYYSPSLARPSLHYSNPPQHSFLFFASLHTQTHHTRVFIFPPLEKWTRDGPITKSQSTKDTTLNTLSHEILWDSGLRISCRKLRHAPSVLWVVTPCSLEERYQGLGGDLLPPFSGKINKPHAKAICRCPTG